MKKLMLLALVAIVAPYFALAEVNGDTIEYKITGKLTYKSGTVVKMQKTDGDEGLVVGQEGELSRSFETELFGGKMTGWISIGNMRVSAISKDIITFTLLKELSVITENGVKKNQFEIGEEVKFVWKIAVSADEALYQKGQDAIESDLNEALGYYMQAIAINPKHAEALNMIGMIQDNQGNLDSALYYFKRASEAQPKDVRYYRNILITAYKLGDYQTAYDNSQKTLELETKEAELWYYRALMLYSLKMNNFTDADKTAILNDMAKAIELEPTSGTYYSERAFIKNVFGDKAGACADAKKAKELGQPDMDEAIGTYCAE
jgi:tetratricopeptide (TPR) repeat protein